MKEQLVKSIANILAIIVMTFVYYFIFKWFMLEDSIKTFPEFKILIDEGCFTLAFILAVISISLWELERNQ